MLDAIGRSYYDLGDYVKALDHYKQALALRQKDPYGQGRTLINIGDVYARRVSAKNALSYFEQGLQLQRAIGESAWGSNDPSKSGRVVSELGNLETAREYFNQGLELSRSIKHRLCEANLLYDIARIDRSVGNLLEARAKVEAAIAIVESSRAW
jgi:tetratricopeptide (TPR) repeat protein